MVEKINTLCDQIYEDIQNLRKSGNYDVEKRLPFKEKYLTDDEIEAECEKMINEFRDATGTDDDCVKLQENVQKIYE